MKASQVYVALDTDTADDALSIVDELSGVASSFKIGSALFTLAGANIVETLVGNGLNVFVDLKFHDIPSVIARACVNLAQKGVQMMTLHAQGGLEMMRTAAEAVSTHWGDRPHKPILLGVTVITSIDETILSEDLGCQRPLREQVLHLAELALKAGLDGVVASGQELEPLKARFGNDLKLLVPGIRPAASEDDQKRTITPARAVEMGADYLVIGRPITQARHVRRAAISILEEVGVSGLR
ncbi:MAG: orotidine-5'-phosphate decarboxylase [Candidatus Coatesbacteria bacterium]|nr:orotidine-5'-phosphate decarboxylase [Candidatus Coatesbacteria bacterium]